jgi:hypothetical protein
MTFPLFPLSLPRSDNTTLRDWFAGQALTAIPHIGCGADLDVFDFARAAYQFADALLAARNEQQP